MEMVQNPYRKLGRPRAPPTLFFHKNNIFVFLEDSYADIFCFIRLVVLLFLLVRNSCYFSGFLWPNNSKDIQRFKMGSRFSRNRAPVVQADPRWFYHCYRVSRVISHQTVCFPNWHLPSTLIVRSIFLPRALNSRSPPSFSSVFTFVPRLSGNCVEKSSIWSLNQDRSQFSTFENVFLAKSKGI